MADRLPHIRVLAPARWAPDEVLRTFAKTVEAEGLIVEIDPQTQLRDHQLAGSDEKRAAALASALAAPDVDVIWCSRGGYGSARTLNHLTDVIVSQPKILIGYSDMTALQLSPQLDGVTHLHGPMPIDAAKPGGADRIAEAARLGRALCQNQKIERNYRLTPVVAGAAAAPLVAANLCVLTTLLGTPHEPKWNGVILCLEDICEYHYAIDRHLCHLAQSRVGQSIAGIVLGDFTDLEDNEVPWGEDVAAMARRHFPGIPIATGLPMGHADQNDVFQQGAAACLTVSKEMARLSMTASMSGQNST